MLTRRSHLELSPPLCRGEDPARSRTAPGPPEPIPLVWCWTLRRGVRASQPLAGAAATAPNRAAGHVRRASASFGAQPPLAPSPKNTVLAGHPGRGRSQQRRRQRRRPRGDRLRCGGGRGAGAAPRVRDRGQPGGTADVPLRGGLSLRTFASPRSARSCARRTSSGAWSTLAGSPS